MNKDLLNSRILEIESDINNTLNSIEQLRANLNALDGAKQDCMYWLNKLDSISQESENKLSETN